MAPGFQSRPELFHRFAFYAGLELSVYAAIVLVVLLIDAHRDTATRGVGEAGNAAQAVTMIRREKPDLLFLDVQMPEGGGFGVIESIGGEYLPEVIFVTAHEHHALRAFDLAALDFLLEPVRGERFLTALEMARDERARGEERSGPGRLSALLDHVAAARRGGGEVPRMSRRFREGLPA